ncbi:ImmA/IrrE family metallo-endopeptidase [Stenotrophomonas maltophilia]|nr:ImmA/IrrE family metallo-endopeptidase [Stenotrophomonas maltophilia]
MTRSIQNFVPERLTQALAARGFSATELAARVGVTNTTISRWRNAVQVPSGAMLEAIASELRVTAEWLTRPIRPATSRPCYRGSIAQLKQDRALLGARMSWLEELSSQLEDYVDYPEVCVPDMGGMRLSDITNAVIEEAAERCRRAWGMGEGPAGDILLLLENAGVVVAREETGVARIEGLSAWSSLGRPFVLLCADKGNAFRSRFDAAHELGHLILHRGIDAPGDATTHKLMEGHAHRFAGAFLLPAKGFSAEVNTPVTLNGLLFLKQRWGVSVGAMIMRLRNLQIIGEEDYLRLIKHRSAKWGQRSEPGDDDREPEQPRLLRRTIELLANEGVVVPEALPDLVGLSGRDVESLMGLPFGHLSGRKADIVELSLKPRERVREERESNLGPSAEILPFGRRGREK